MIAPVQPMTDNEPIRYKQCVHCMEQKPETDFLRRTGRRSGTGSRRGSCRSCRKHRSRIPAATISYAESELPPNNQIEHSPVSEAAAAKPVSQAAPLTVPDLGTAVSAPAPAAPTAPRRPRPKSSPRGGANILKPRPRPLPANHSPSDVSLLRTTRKGTVWMRGRTDKGRRWHQEIELELAVTLVKERAAVIVNRTTIRRLFSNKDFRSFILTRDNYTCHFCGQYGDTIDHMLPRAKGGHTTPDNCVCACNDCNQSKADKDIEEFMRDL
ncbi:HNH endonuclease [Paenibacillus sp. YAF4_2]